MKRIDKQTFSKVRGWIHISRAKSIARRFGIAESTVLDIRGCKNFEEYREVVKANHPPIKYSLAEHILQVHRAMFDRADGKYVEPLTARAAITEIEGAAITVHYEH